MRPLRLSSFEVHESIPFEDDPLETAAALLAQARALEYTGAWELSIRKGWLDQQGAILDFVAKRKDGENPSQWTNTLSKKKGPPCGLE